MSEYFVDENTVMRFYLEELAGDRIEFLKGKPEAREKVAGMVEQLLQTEKMNDRIQIASGLWKLLFEYAMSLIDPDKQGYDRLFQYFDEYVEFEELIFASDSFYRDHTLHCMWVYFLGEYLHRKPEFHVLFESEEEMERIPKLVGEAVRRMGLENSTAFRDLCIACDGMEKLEHLWDSIRCIAALTHDLGYPLKKIEKINKSIRKVLPYFSINTFDEFKFEYANVNQHFIEKFLDFLCANVSVTVNGGEAEKLLGKLFLSEDGKLITGVDTDYIDHMTPEEIEQLKKEASSSVLSRSLFSDSLAYINDFESYQHGIMSAFLLMKNVKAFQNVQVMLEKKLDMSNINYEEYFSKITILDAISAHTCESRKITRINGANFLTFVDELEEFSRISRASQSREYIEEFCSTELFMEDGWLNIDFTFDNNDLDNLDPERAFKGRCKRFLTLFHIRELDPKLKIRLRCIGKLLTDSSVYQLEIARKYAVITIDGEEKNIPKYLKSIQFYTSEEYAKL